MASIDRRPNGRWRARWREYPGGPQKTRSFVKKGDAERFLDGIRGDLARGVYIDPRAADVTFRDFTAAWMARQPWRPGTRARASSIVKAQLEPAFGDRTLGSLRTSELQTFVGALRETLAPATVEGVHRLLAQILRAAVVDRVLPFSPSDGVRLPRRDGQMVAPLTIVDVERLAAGIVAELRAAVLFAAMTGLRQGELFGLTEDRVRWLAREVVIDRQLLTEPGGLRLGPLKTSRSVRVVPLTDGAVELLSEQVRTYGFGDLGVVFHRDGRPWRRNRASAAMRDAGGSGWHALRHHCASVLIAQGLSVTAVAAVLGHSPAECLSTYAAWWPSEDESIRAALVKAWAAAEDRLRTAEPPGSP